MPCDTVQITALDVSKMRPDLLRKALESMGYTVIQQTGERVWAQRGRDQITIDRGKLIMQAGGASEELQTNLQRAYSREVVSESAKRAGFVVTRKADYQLELSKRY